MGLHSGRNFHSTIINEDTVFVFGGRDSEHFAKNNLHILDMVSVRWREVPEIANSNWVPRARSHHSLTRISKAAALLVGGFNSLHGITDDCWILDLKKASQAIDMS